MQLNPIAITKCQFVKTMLVVLLNHAIVSYFNDCMLFLEKKGLVSIKQKEFGHTELLFIFRKYEQVMVEPCN